MARHGTRPRPGRRRVALVAALLCALLISGCERMPPDALGELPTNGGDAAATAPMSEANGQAATADDQAAPGESSADASDARVAGDDGPSADTELPEGTTSGQTAAGDARAASAPTPTVDGYPSVATRVPGTAGPAPTGVPGAPGSVVAGADVQGLSADMLNATEIARAQQAALGSSAVQALVASAVDRSATVDAAAGEVDAAALRALAERPSYRVLYTQRAPGKAAEGRRAEVAVYRYDTGQAVVSEVDLDSGAVTSTATDPERPLPMVREEILEAASVARRDPQVRAALEDAGLDPETAPVNALMTAGAAPDAPCREHRCLKLFFSDRANPVPTFSAVVDLVTLEVVDVIPMPGRSLNP